MFLPLKSCPGSISVRNNLLTGPKRITFKQNTVSFYSKHCAKKLYLRYNVTNINIKRAVQTTSQRSTLNFINSSNKHQPLETLKHELSNLTVKGLKQQLRLYNLKVGGNKSQLVDRLANFKIEQQRKVSSGLTSKDESRIQSINVCNKEKNNLKSDVLDEESSDSRTLNAVSDKENSTTLGRTTAATTHFAETSKKSYTKSQDAVKIMTTKPKTEKKAPAIKKTTTKIVEALKETPEDSQSNLFKAGVTIKNNKSTEHQPYELEDLPDYTLTNRDIFFMTAFLSFSTLWLLFFV